MNADHGIGRRGAQFRMLALHRLIQLSIWTVVRMESWTAVPASRALRRCGPGGETDLIEHLPEPAKQQLKACPGPWTFISTMKSGVLKKIW